MSANPLTPDSTPLEVRKAWAERLRKPGHIVQGAGCLAPADGQRCCLGVLCDMAVEVGLIDGYESGDPFPPPIVDSWAALAPKKYFVGVTECDDPNEADLETLPSLNDSSAGYTFADIADLLDDGLVLGPDDEVLQ